MDSAETARNGVSSGRNAYSRSFSYPELPPYPPLPSPFPPPRLEPRVSLPKPPYRLPPLVTKLMPPSLPVPWYLDLFALALRRSCLIFSTSDNRSAISDERFRTGVSARSDVHLDRVWDRSGTIIGHVGC